MPVKRRRKVVVKKRSKISKKIILFLIFILLILILSILFLASGSIKGEKYVVSYENADGSAKVVVYDMGKTEATAIVVPAETYLDAAYGFGQWRVASLGELGRQENFDGQLLKMSLVKNFHFPIDAWVSGESLISSDTSLDIRQKIQLLWFTFRLPKQNYSELDLGNSGYLAKSKLPDGQDGYLLNRQLPAELSTAFSTFKSSELFRVGIFNASDRAGKSVENLSQVIHILGGDWVIVQKEVQDIDCIIKGNDREVVERIGGILACQITEEKIESNFDIEITVGDKFVNRF